MRIIGWTQFQTRSVGWASGCPLRFPASPQLLHALSLLQHLGTLPRALQEEQQMSLSLFLTLIQITRAVGAPGQSASLEDSWPILGTRSLSSPRSGAEMSRRRLITPSLLQSLLLLKSNQQVALENRLPQSRSGFWLGMQQRWRRSSHQHMRRI